MNSSGSECVTLAVGAVCELTGAYTVTQADVDAGEVSNTARASADGVTAAPVSEVTAVAQERALELAVSPNPSSYEQVGDEITYTYTVTNSGTVTLAGTVTVADDKATGIECTALPAGGLAPAGTTTCSGSYTTVQADVDAGEVTNRATASVDEVTSAAATATVGWRAGELNQGAVLSITGVQVAESAGAVGFVVNLSPSSLQTVTVGYATANGTAEASLDYTGTSGTLTFGPGATARTIAVAVIDDELKEEKESFALELSEPWNARLLGSVEKLSGSATITDDDAEPEITSGSALTVAEGQTALANGQLSATDEDQETSELTWSIPAGTAGGADRARFEITSGGLLSLKAAQDYENPGDADGDRVYEVTVEVSDGANAVTADLEVTLQDVEATVTVAADTATIEEGEAAVFTVTRADDLSGALTVAVAVGQRGTVLASGGSGTKRVSFADGTRTATLSVATADDATPEPGGTVTAAVQTRTGYTVGTPGRAEVTVLDNDASTLTLSAQPQEVAEDASATDVTVTAAWAAGTRAAATELTVNVGRSGDSATEGSDYTAVDDLTLTIDAGVGSTTGTFELEPKDDAVDESDESLTVTTALTGLTVNPALLTIRDDDERGIVVQPQTLTITEGENGSYTVVLTSQPTDTVTVTPSVSGAGAGDVSVSAEVLTFTATSWRDGTDGDGEQRAGRRRGRRRSDDRAHGGGSGLRGQRGAGGAGGGEGGRRRDPGAWVGADADGGARGHRQQRGRDAGRRAAVHGASDEQRQRGAGRGERERPAGEYERQRVRDAGGGRGVRVDRRLYGDAGGRGRRRGEQHGACERGRGDGVDGERGDGGGAGAGAGPGGEPEPEQLRTGGRRDHLHVHGDQQRDGDAGGNGDGGGRHGDRDRMRSAAGGWTGSRWGDDVQRQLHDGAGGRGRR